VTWLVLSLLLLTLVAWVRLALRWRHGSRAAVAPSDILAVPRRYLRDVHDVVARRPEAARMHSLAAGGALGGSAVALTGHFAPLACVCFAIGLIGAGLAARRRWPRTPPQLTRARFRWLPLWLGAYMAGGALAVFEGPTHGPGLVLATFGGLALLAQTVRGPMRHALAGLVSLAAPARPARFAGLSTDVSPADLTAPTLGVRTLADFTWNRLASFDACVQCGRCEQACPAHAAGQALNPKAFIQSLVTADRTGPIIGTAIAPDALWACTTCRACVQECPMLIEHVDAIIDLRRHQTLAHGAVPEGAVAPLAELRYADNAAGRAGATRGDFAAGLDLPVLAEGNETDVLLWLGEGAFDLRYGSSLRALLRLLQQAGVEFAWLGAEERDCGDLARRLGDEATFQRLAAENIATLTRRRFARIVTADPHALHVLRREYPAFGGRWTVQHHTELLDQLVQSGRLVPRRGAHRAVTYHDPCYLARYNGQLDAPRRLLDALGDDRVEMARHGMTALCCGGGGGAPVSDVPGERRIADIRMAQARDVGATVIAVACPGCTAMLEAVTGQQPLVRDIAELLAEACA
jgi:Fe-S oxidoreductase